MNITTWNVQGLNDSIKRKEVRKLIATQNITVMGILETRTRDCQMEKVSKDCFGRDWSFFHNSDGQKSNIWVGLNNNLVEVKKLYDSKQVVMVEIIQKETIVSYFFAAVYGSNEPSIRKLLSRDLENKIEDNVR